MRHQLLTKQERFDHANLLMARQQQEQARIEAMLVTHDAENPMRVQDVTLNDGWIGRRATNSELGDLSNGSHDNERANQHPGRTVAGRQPHFRKQHRLSPRRPAHLRAPEHDGHPDGDLPFVCPRTRRSTFSLSTGIRAIECFSGADARQHRRQCGEHDWRDFTERRNQRRLIELASAFNFLESKGGNSLSCR